MKLRVRSPSLPPVGRKLGSCLARQYFCAACIATSRSNGEQQKLESALQLQKLRCHMHARTSLPPSLTSVLTSDSVNLDMEIDLTRCANSRLQEVNTKRISSKSVRAAFSTSLTNCGRRANVLDATAGRADERVEIQTDVLRHLIFQ